MREDQPGSREVFWALNGVDLARRSLQGVDGMNFFDFNAVNAISQEFSPASPDILADELQQLLLPGVGHGLRERHIDNALLGQNAQRRPGLGALGDAIHAELGGGGFVILNRAGDVANQAFNRYGVGVLRILRGILLCGQSRGCQKKKTGGEDAP